MPARALAAALALVLLLLTGGCRTSSNAALTREVRIAAAADLKFALDDLIVEFKRHHPAIEVKATYGASGSFFAQLKSRAPFDLFLSADMEYPRQLIEQDLALKETAFTYAVGHLVLWVPKSCPLDLARLGMGALRKPVIRKVAIANPQHAPYGRAAELRPATASIVSSSRHAWGDEAWLRARAGRDWLHAPM